MSITKLTRHDRHEIEIVYLPAEHAHWAELRCKPCNKHVQWLSKTQAETLNNLGVKISTSVSQYNNKEKHYGKTKNIPRCRPKTKSKVP
jgi:hypothetical protein